MTGRADRLVEIRREIDSLDDALLDLLNRRARAALEVGAVKSGEAEPRFYRPERETAVVRRLVENNEGPLSDPDVARLFREIMSTCRALEQRIAVGCATVGEACAAVGHFGGAVDIVAASDSREALEFVEHARCDFAAVGFSDSGEALPVLASLPDRELAVCAEWYARGSERYFVVGTSTAPPTGNDWTAMVVPAQGVAAIASWCRDRGVVMRSTAISTVVTSTLVEVALHADDSLVGRLAADGGAAIVGSFPSADSG